MNRLIAGAMVLVCGAIPLTAQSLEDLKIQIHGYATQGFLYSTKNNWNSTNSTDGSAAWTEAVFNLTAQPKPKLRIGIQARYFLLGSYGNAITLDWASADYKVNERFGVRFGKVKTPNGLLNEIQDIDPAYIWSVLPESNYPIASRNTILAHYGGVAYGTVAPIRQLGKFEYRAFAGARVLASNDGFFASINAHGIYFPNGLSGSALGGALNWNTPVHGLMLGAAVDREHISGAVTIPAAGLSGTNMSPAFAIPYFFGRYENNRFMFAGEYSRVAVENILTFAGVPPVPNFVDARTFYAMTSYKLAGKLTAGAYYSYYLDHKAALGPSRYLKDWVISGRYDFNEFLYAKAEQHFIDGTDVVFLSTDNANPAPTSKLTVLKIGVSF